MTNDELKEQVKQAFIDGFFGLLQHWDIIAEDKMSEDMVNFADKVSEKIVGMMPDAQAGAVEAGELRMSVRDFEFSTRRGGRFRIDLEMTGHDGNLGELRKGGSVVLRVGGLK